MIIKKLIVIIFCCGFMLSAEEKNPEKLTLYYFGSSTCGECAEIKEMLLTPLAEDHSEKLSIEFHDIDDEKSFQLLINLEKKYSIAENSPQELFFPDTVLLGYEAIVESGEELIQSILNSPKRWKPRFTIDTSSESSSKTIIKKEQEIRLLGKKTGPLEYLRDLGMLVFGILCLVFRKKRYMAIAGQLILGAVFIIAGRKVGATRELTDIIRAYGILPPSLILPAAIALPWVELLAGLMLITGVFPKAGASVITAMNAMFIPALLYRSAVVASKDGLSFFAVSFNCGCGLGENLAWVLILRDVGYLLIGLSVILFFTSIWDLKALLAKKGR